MKKWLLALFTSLFPAAGALAETAAAGEALYDWPQLGTLAGSAAAVLLVVQYTKEGLDKLIKLPTRLYVYVLSLLILLGASVFAGSFAWQNAPFLLLTAVVVANSAMGAYEQTFGRAGA